MVELARADVDRQPLLDAQPAPARDRLGDARDHPVADLDDQPGFLGARDEAARQPEAVDRMLPAQQRLGGDDRDRRARPPAAGRPARTGRSLDRVAQIGFELRALGDLRRRAPAVKCSARPLPCALAWYMAASAARIRSVSVVPCSGAVGDADRRADRRPPEPADLERLGPARPGHRAPTRACGLVGQPGQEDRELVARQPPDQRLFDAVDGRRRLRGRRAAGWRPWASSMSPVAWPRRVVDRLEPVEIDEQQRAPASSAASPASTCSHVRRKLVRLGKPGHRIEHRQPLRRSRD